MLRRILRVLFGFVLACLAAAATTVVFADIQELKTLSEAASQELLSTTGIRILFSAVQGAIFAAPIAFVGILIGEWRHIRSWTYYTLLALVIALLGFLAWSTSEGFNEPTIVNNYAMTAFLTTGFVGGLFYWLFSGRRAGTPVSRHADYDYVNTPASATRGSDRSSKSTVTTKSVKSSSRLSTEKNDKPESLSEQLAKDKVSRALDVGGKRVDRMADAKPQKPSLSSSSSSTSVPKTSTPIIKKT